MIDLKGWVLPSIDLCPCFPTLEKNTKGTTSAKGDRSKVMRMDQPPWSLTQAGSASRKTMHLHEISYFHSLRDVHYVSGGKGVVEYHSHWRMPQGVYHKETKDSDDVQHSCCPDMDTFLESNYKPGPHLNPDTAIDHAKYASSDNHPRILGRVVSL